jgi:hypothetical protein
VDEKCKCNIYRGGKMQKREGHRKVRGREREKEKNTQRSDATSKMSLPMGP